MIGYTTTGDTTLGQHLAHRLLCDHEAIPRGFCLLQLGNEPVQFVPQRLHPLPGGDLPHDVSSLLQGKQPYA